jgi:hypothetical protein
MTRRSWLPRQLHRSRCAHCWKRIFSDGQPHDYFMVKNELWERHGVGPGLLCFHCFESSLGRSLTLNDFVNCGASVRAQEFVAERLQLKVQRGARSRDGRA